MNMAKKNYNVFTLVLIGIFSIIIINIVKLGHNKNDAEAKTVHQPSVQDSTIPLIVTGRRELNGFKGYYHYRRGYRKYSDNWWYPEAAFFAPGLSKTKDVSLKTLSELDSKTIFLFSSLEQKEPLMFKKHIDSCSMRYRSYDKSDNSYQPFQGSRKQCFSRFLKDRT
ncbi:BA14K family protein [Bartonella doshiae]|uniref:BA14K family protein n=1 Tax=Bartonella doshiae TaxID=33044 RepID=UPI000943FCB1|nr:BA14K family protein [Bartonella doshiae]